jgi:hypothetical protein
MDPQRTSSASRWGKTSETDAFPTEFSHLGLGMNHGRADRKPMRLEATPSSPVAGSRVTIE